MFMYCWSAGLNKTRFTVRASTSGRFTQVRTAFARASASECWFGVRRSISMRFRRAASLGLIAAARACRAA
jgi:hypothetical protein